MNAGKVVGGLVVLALVGGGALALKKHWINIPFLQKPKPTVLAQGTKVPLVLVDNLSSGGSKEGQDVTLLVTSDIKVGQDVILARGSTIHAVVTHSRGATAGSAILNQPARLEISFKPASTETGQALTLGPAKGDTFAFTQDNTTNRKDAAKIDRLWSTPEGKQDLEDLQKSVTDGGIHIPDQAAFRKLADGIGLDKTKKLLDQPRTNLPPDKLLADASKGDFVGMAGFDQVLALEALGEIGSVTRAIDDHVRGIFKGNNIDAPAGTPVDVVVKQKLVIPSR